MKKADILLLDFTPSSSLGGRLRDILASVPHWAVSLKQVFVGDKGSAAYKQYLTNDPDIVFLVLPAALLKQGDRLFQHFQGAALMPSLIVVPEAGEPDDILKLLEVGVADFITPPLTALNILPRVRRLLEHTDQLRAPLHRVKKHFGSRQLIGESEVFRATVKKIPLIARCDAGVLISGETGTGKELCARAIHYLSPRAAGAFVPVNCGAIPTELVENELFGHERGAFTNAVSAQAGLIEEADGGTLFLDEADCLPLLAQVKLLRFLQEREYRPLGTAKTRRADVRVIAAATVDFDEAIRTGKLRQDLYYRLNVIGLRLPPLRERAQDIPLLARHFLARYAVDFDKPALSFSPDALELLSHYHWPGNVRELQHMIERAVALSEGEVIEGDDLSLPDSAMSAHPTSFREAKTRFERTYIEDLLVAHDGNISRAARAANKNRRAFWELIRKHQIDVSRFRPKAKSRSTSK
jgi:DNA-binding NtrC family response regulator